MDPLLLLALALIGGGAAPLAPVASSLAAAGLAVVLWRGVGAAPTAQARARARWFWLAAAVLFALQAVRARGALEAAAETHTGVADALRGPTRCEAEAVVVTSPVILRRGAGAGPSADAGRVDVAITSLQCTPREGEDGPSEPVTPLRARLYGAPEDLARGDQLLVLADLAPVHLFLNDGMRDARAGIARSGIAMSGGAVQVDRVSRGRGVGASIDVARAHVRGRIEATFHPEAAPLARALVLGETDLDPEDDEAFRVSGLAHLLAVSGTHLILAVLGVVAALRAVMVRIEPLAARCDVGRIAAAASIPLAWLYADFAGGSGSAIRAAAMLSAAMLPRAFGHRPRGVRALAASILGAAVVDPLAVMDVSFGLSAAATAGLLFLSRPIARAMVRGPALLHRPLEAIATTLAAMIACAPQLLSISPTLPAVGIAANVVAAPIGELAALPICLVHAVLGWAPAAERGAAIVGSGALLSVRSIARAAGSVGGAVPLPPPTDAQLVVLIVSVAAVWAARSAAARIGRAAIATLGLLALELAAIRAGAPEGVLRVTVIDVGQGDAALVDLPDGSAILVDGGGFVGSPVDTGKRVILPLLRQRRRSRVAAMVLSHPHPDHFGGLVSAAPRLEVGELWDTGQGESEGAGPAYASLIEGMRARGVPVRRPGDLCGARDLGGARVEVLAPCPGPGPDSSANDNSFVIRVTLGRRAVLLVGDAEHEAEARLVGGDPRALRADLLKVGHHGSRTSTGAAFLAAVAPELAVISCGVRNRFGHPHAPTMATLADARVEIARTDRGGSVVWETDGNEVRVTRP